MEFHKNNKILRTQTKEYLTIIYNAEHHENSHFYNIVKDKPMFLLLFSYILYYTHFSDTIVMKVHVNQLKLQIFPDEVARCLL